jgi:hypothetical protein
MLPVLQRPDSLLWVDLMDRQAVDHPEQYAETIRNFLRGMQILGEPFTFGTSTIPEFMESVGLRSLEVVPSDVCLRGRKDPVYEIYRFCVAAAAVSDSQSGPPATFRLTRTDKRSRTPTRPHAPSTEPRRATSGSIRRAHRNGSAKSPRV